jgi:hypothetical protein
MLFDLNLFDAWPNGPQWPSINQSVWSDSGLIWSDLSSHVCVCVCVCVSVSVSVSVSGVSV